MSGKIKNGVTKTETEATAKTLINRAGDLKINSRLSEGRSVSVRILIAVMHNQRTRSR